MTTLKDLVISEIVDFYAGFESPGEPETVDEAQRQLIGRIEKVFGLAAPAQPVIPEQSELRYGDNVLWFLNELAAFDSSDIDSDDFDVYGEGRNGMEGFATISITELAADAAKLLSAQPVSEPYKFHQGWIKGQFAYQDLFNAIGSAVVSKHPSIEISVKAFEDSMLAAAPAQESE